MKYLLFLISATICTHAMDQHYVYPLTMSSAIAQCFSAAPPDTLTIEMPQKLGVALLVHARRTVGAGLIPFTNVITEICLPLTNKESNHVTVTESEQLYRLLSFIPWNGTTVKENDIVYHDVVVHGIQKRIGISGKRQLYRNSPVTLVLTLKKR